MDKLNEENAVEVQSVKFKAYQKTETKIWQKLFVFQFYKCWE